MLRIKKLLNKKATVGDLDEEEKPQLALITPTEEPDVQPLPTDEGDLQPVANVDHPKTPAHHVSLRLSNLNNKLRPVKANR